MNSIRTKLTLAALAASITTAGPCLAGDPLVDLDEIFGNMASPSYLIRDQATLELSIALEEGVLDEGQLALVRSVARGDPGAAGTSTEVRVRTRMALQGWVCDTLSQTTRIIDDSRVAWSAWLDAESIGSFRVGNGAWVGVATTDAARAIVDSLSMHWRTVRDELSTGHADNALLALQEMFVVIASLSDSQWSSLQLQTPEGVAVSHAEWLLRIVECLKGIPGASTELESAIGLADEPIQVCAIPSPLPPGADLLCDSQTIRIVLDGGCSSGALDLSATIRPDDAGFSLPPGFEFAGPAFELTQIQPMQLHGAGHVEVEIGPGLLVGAPPVGQSPLLRLTTFSSGRAYLLEPPPSLPPDPFVVAGSLAGVPMESNTLTFAVVQVVPIRPQADLNGDCVVDGDDLGALLGYWGFCPGCPADFNDDGYVDGADLGELLGQWSAQCTLPEMSCSNTDCCEPGTFQGCGDSSCCEQVCAVDPFCCAARWDARCADAALGCGLCPPPPTILGFFPPLIQNDTIVTIDLMNFPIDPIDLDAFFVTEAPNARIPIQVLQIHDFDNDERADLIVGKVDGIFASEYGKPLELHIKVHDSELILNPNGALPPLVVANDDDAPDVAGPDDGEGDEVVQPSVAERGSAEGEFEPGNDAGPEASVYRIQFPEGSWAANSIYSIRLNVHLRYQRPNPDGGAPIIKTEFYYLSPVWMPTGPNGSQAACLNTIAAFLNSMIMTGSTDLSRATILENFEWVREGDTLALKKKADSEAGVVLLPYGPTSNRPDVIWRLQ